MNKADIRMLDRMANAKMGDYEFVIDLPAKWFEDEEEMKRLQEKRRARIRVYVDLWKKHAEVAQYKDTADIRTIEYGIEDYRHVMWKLREVYRQTAGRSWNIE